MNAPAVSERSYQTEAVDATLAAWARGERTVVALPTGVGKTVIASRILARLEADGARHVRFVVHRDQLARQALRQFRAFGLGAGAQTGKLRAAPDAAVQVVTIQWLLRHLDTLPPALDAFIIDEAHHATALSYRDALTAAKPARVLGLTATVLRADGAALGQVFDSIAYHQPIRWFVDAGYLVPVSSYAVTCDMDFSAARVSRETGDFIFNDPLLSALEASNWKQVITSAWLEHARGRKTIAFCASIDHSRQLAAAFQALGVSAVHLDHHATVKERKAALDAFRAGETRVLCNVGLFTEGYDEPGIECVLMARPTQSQLFYIQCVGRALRPAPGKTAALVLDFASNTHSLVQFADLDTDRRAQELRDALPVMPGWTSAFFNQVFLSLAQRRAILHFSAGNAYLRALELLHNPHLGWTCFGDCALLDVRENATLLVVSPGRARGCWRQRELLRPYADAGVYALLALEQGRVSGVASGTADEIVEVASAIAERLATRMADGTARWRRDAISRAQWGFLTRAGLAREALVGLNKGQASALISYVKACQLLGMSYV